MGSPHWVRFSKTKMENPFEKINPDFLKKLSSHNIDIKYLSAIVNDDNQDLLIKCWETFNFENFDQIKLIIETNQGISLSLYSSKAWIGFSLNLWRADKSYLICMDVDREVIYGAKKQKEPGDWLSWLLTIFAEHFECDCAGISRGEDYTTHTFLPLDIKKQIQEFESGQLFNSPAPFLFLFVKDNLELNSLELGKLKTAWKGVTYEELKDYLIFKKF